MYVNGEVQLTGSNITDAQAVPVKQIGSIVTATIINAMSVGAGGNTGQIDLGITNEDYDWIVINIDQQPWTATIFGFPWSAGSQSTVGLYPARASVVTTYPSTGIPAISLLQGIAPSSGFGLTPPTTMQDAMNYRKAVPGLKIKIDNASASIATVTVKIIRVKGL